MVSDDFSAYNDNGGEHPDAADAPNFAAGKRRSQEPVQGLKLFQKSKNERNDGAGASLTTTLAMTELSDKNKSSGARSVQRVVLPTISKPQHDRALIELAAPDQDGALELSSTNKQVAAPNT